VGRGRETGRSGLKGSEGLVGWAKRSEKEIEGERELEGGFRT
jgi:hypothetical protein